MRYAFCLEMLYSDLPFYRRLEMAKGDGINAFEIWGWREKNIDALVNQMTDLEMSVTNMSGNRRFGMMEPKDQQAFLRELRESSEIATRLNCPTLMLLVQPLRDDNSAKLTSQPLSKAQKLEQIIICGNEAGNLVEEFQLEIVIEPLNSVLDHPGYFLDSSKLAFEIIRTIDHPRVKLLYDLYHMAMMEENILLDLEQNLDAIGYLHLADKPGRHEPGSGEIDYAQLRALLKSLNYEGVVGFEFSPSDSDSRSAVQKVLRDFC